MKKSHLILAAIIVASAAFVGFKSATQETKYEYKTITIPVNPSIGRTDEQFNKVGVEGYRMIRIDVFKSPQGSTFWAYTFEKELNY